MPAAGGRELHRIGEQVPQHLLQPARIAGHQHGFLRHHQVDTDLLGIRGGRVPSTESLHQLHQVHGLGLQADLPDTMRLMSSRSSMICACALGIAVDGLDGRDGHLRLRQSGMPAQQRCPTHDGGQRRAQLVRQCRQEFIFQVTQPFGFGARVALRHQQLLALEHGLAQAADVARNLRSADHGTSDVPQAAIP